jgi:DNA-binding MarR family transcriptional regulator
MNELNNQQYQVLFAFRSALRQYLQWSASHAARFGLAPQQAQLLLAIRVRSDESPPSISELAAALQIRQHSAVGLANRAQRAGLVTRTVDSHDQRVVRIALTEQGRRVIAQLAELHLAELEMVAGALHLSDEFLAQLSHQFAGLLPSSDGPAGDPDAADAPSAPPLADRSADGASAPDAPSTGRRRLLAPPRRPAPRLGPLAG